MNRGFTLIEMVVTIGILAALTAVLMVTLDPLGQLNKAQNSNREQGLTAVKAALEEYISDQKCYPVSLTFGSNLTVSGKTYISLPQDPNCHKGGWCYIYETDGSTCPQWYVIYYSLQQTNTNLTQQCPLATQQNCLPPNMLSTKYNSCFTSEDYNCSYISQHDITPLQ